MKSVTKEVSRDFMVNKVLPAIKAKWPAEERGMPIFIQKDNAKTHIAVDDPAFVHIVGHAARGPLARPAARHFGPARARHGPTTTVPGPPPWPVAWLRHGTTARCLMVQ